MSKFDWIFHSEASASYFRRGEDIRVGIKQEERGRRKGQAGLDGIHGKFAWRGFGTAVTPRWREMETAINLGRIDVRLRGPCVDEKSWSRRRVEEWLINRWKVGRWNVDELHGWFNHSVSMKPYDSA